MSSRDRSPKDHLERELQRSRSELEQTICELERTNAQLRDSEGRARTLIAASSQMVWTTSASGQVVEDSPSWREFTGQSYAEWIGSGWLDVVHPDDRESTFAAWKHSAQSGEPYVVEYRVRRADGEWRWTAARGVPQRNADGNVLRWIGMNTDITDRKESEAREQRLKESLATKERRLSMAMHAGGMAAWEWSPQGSIWDEQLFDLLGISRQTPPSTALFFDCVHPEDRPALQQAWEAAIGGRRAYDHEVRIVRPDGEIRWLAGVGESTRDPAGNVSRIYGMNWDITARKTIEQKEKRQQQIEHFLSETSAALASSLDYEMTLDKVTRLCVPILADWAFIDLIDLDERDVRRVSVAHADPQHAGLAEEVARFPARRQSADHPPARGLFGAESFVIAEFTDELLVKAAQSPEHEQVLRQVGPRSFVVVPLVARGTTFGALTLIASDSGRTFGSEDLAVAEELTRRAAIAIDNARLYQAGQLANAAKSEFLANMSHEIRTPMTAILGYADLLALGEDDPRRAEFCEIIKRNGRFLLEIINDILDLSRIEAGKLEVVRESFAPRDLVEDIHSLMLVRAQEKHLDFDVHVEPAVPETILSDPKRLRQILVNLLGNAIKFTESGSVRLRVGFREDASTPQLFFEVIDTGIGISAAQRQRLFEAFAQGDAHVTQQYGGTGLGLTISRRLASMLGGDVTVSSRVGEGSTFRCTITPGRTSGAASLSGQRNAPRDRLSDGLADADLSCTVLVVDDQRDVRYLTRHLLTEAGAVVECAEDGRRALELVRRDGGDGRAFDVILLDMQMPHMDGYQTATELRALGFSSPIIALTADAMPGSTARCLECGCDAFLSKPIDAPSLIDCILRFTNGHRTVGAGQTIR